MIEESITESLLIAVQDGVESCYSCESEIAVGEPHVILIGHEDNEYCICMSCINKAKKVLNKYKDF